MTAEGAEDAEKTWGKLFVKSFPQTPFKNFDVEDER